MKKQETTKETSHKDSNCCQLGSLFSNNASHRYSPNNLSTCSDFSDNPTERLFNNNNRKKKQTTAKQRMSCTYWSGSKHVVVDDFEVTHIVDHFCSKAGKIIGLNNI